MISSSGQRWNKIISAKEWKIGIFAAYLLRGSLQPCQRIKFLIPAKIWNIFMLRYFEEQTNKQKYIWNLLIITKNDFLKIVCFKQCWEFFFIRVSIPHPEKKNFFHGKNIWKLLAAPQCVAAHCLIDTGINKHKTF